MCKKKDPGSGQAEGTVGVAQKEQNQTGKDLQGTQEVTRQLTQLDGEG